MTSQIILHNVVYEYFKILKNNLKYRGPHKKAARPQAQSKVSENKYEIENLKKKFFILESVRIL